MIISEADLIRNHLTPVCLPDQRVASEQSRQAVNLPRERRINPRTSTTGQDTFLQSSEQTKPFSNDNMYTSVTIPLYTSDGKILSKLSSEDQMETHCSKD